jgi:CheY-like chemotaxis protein
MRPVLIVDDDLATRESIAEALELSGFAVIVARDGDEAVALASRELPAAIVVDYVMPRMSGVDVINRLHAMPGMQDLCAILATAWEGVLEALNPPAAFVLQKPFTIEMMVEMLERCGVRPPETCAPAP